MQIHEKIYIVKTVYNEFIRVLIGLSVLLEAL